MSNQNNEERNYVSETKKPSFEIYALLDGKNCIISENALSVKTNLSSPHIKKGYLVGRKKVRINRTKADGATGYIIYRRNSEKGAWKKVATISGESQLYCYDTSVSAKKEYYYAVKAFVKADNSKVNSSLSKGKKASFKKTPKTVIKGDYKTGSVYGPALTSKQLSQVKSTVKKFCDNYITTDMNNLEKILTAQLYMAGNCTYAATWKKNGANTAWGSLVYKNSRGYHEAQCSGYARGFKALCDAMGIKCRYVHANSKSINPSHQWNEVKLNGKWYIVDPQGNSTSKYLAFFLCSGKTYTKNSGMKWNKKAYPAVSSSDYPTKKILAACNEYKIQQVQKRVFK